MRLALEALTVTCLGLVFYSYVVYPALLLVLGSAHQCISDLRYVSSKRNRRHRVPDAWPTVGIVIAAYNEQAHIERRLANLLELDYAAGRLRIYVGSDGSTDQTAQLLASCRHPAVRSFIFEHNRGKAAVLNDLIDQASEEVIVLSDANSYFAPGALKALVAHFANPRVGGVSGELRLSSLGAENQDGNYWRFEQLLKFLESRIGGLLGANGSIYALRKSLWQPLQPDTICDDFCAGMNVAAAGYRLVYEPAAWAEEDAPQRISDEYQRRLRIGIGNYQALFRHPEYLLRTSWPTRLTYLSHKVIRWLAPHLLLIAYCCSVGLASEPDWRWLACLQTAAYLAAVAAYVLGTGRRHGAAARPIPRALRPLAYLFALNFAFLMASVRFVRGHYSGSWQRTARDPIRTQ